MQMLWENLQGFPVGPSILLIIFGLLLMIVHGFCRSRLIRTRQQRRPEPRGEQRRGWDVMMWIQQHARPGRTPRSTDRPEEN